MPRSSKKNHKRVINSDFDANNSRLNDESNKPTFPPTLTINDLIKKDNTNNKLKAIPNAFIAYRMALIKEYRINNRKLPPMGEVSKIAKSYWNTEPKNVKDFYESLIKEAKSIYKQNNIKFVLDKHMNYVEESGVNCDAEEPAEVQLD